MGVCIFMTPRKTTAQTVPIIFMYFVISIHKLWRKYSAGENIYDSLVCQGINFHDLINKLQESTAQ